MNITLSIIIVNYNGQTFFEACFESIKQKLSDIDYEIVVLDNCSKDNSVAFIKEKYPEIVLIESKENLGFGKGNNEAVKHAKGQNILLLNNDTILLDRLDDALHLVNNNITIGAIGIKMLDRKKKYIYATGNFPNIINLFWMKRAFLINNEFRTGIFSKDIYEVDWLTGSFILMRKAIYEAISGFDEDYFLYVEDVDFSKRIEKLGLKRIFLTKFSYIHFVGFNKSKNPLLVKGYKTFISKHYKGFYKTVCFAALLINSSIKKLKNGSKNQ